MRRAVLPRWSKQRSAVGLVVLIVLVGIIHGLMAPVYGAELGNRELQLTNNNTSVTAGYDLSFSISTPGTLGSISIEFCSNDPLLEDVCTAPTGLDDSNAGLVQQTGQTGFSIDTTSTANHIILTRTPSAATAGPVAYDFTNITNPNQPGSYYVRLQTFATSDASGNSSDYGGIAFIIMNNLSVSATVPPYLIFCSGITIPEMNCDSASGNYIDFGALSATATSRATSQLMTATNAKNGYSITLSGTTMMSGNDVIAPITADDVSRPGTAQFGLNLTTNTSPPIGSTPSGLGTGMPTAAYDKPNFYQFNSGDVVVTNATTDNLRRYTASYIVNVPTNQPAGIYTSTITYICLANF